MSPRRSRSKLRPKIVPVTEDQAAEWIAQRYLQAHIELQLPDASGVCLSCGAPITASLSGAVIKVVIE